MNKVRLRDDKRVHIVRFYVRKYPIFKSQESKKFDY